MVGPQGLFQCLLLSCKDSWKLAELSACLVSCIWKGATITTASVSIPSSLKRDNTTTSTSINVFKQFCQKIFQDTQISSGCILLALYYLQELRSIYPTLRGTLGSEFRIFTTALILANKYLDDNTFTNRTWSEVSGIPIHELNIMEMEYLTALDYKLHVHCSQFRAWATQCQQFIQTPTPRSLKRSSTTSHYPSPSHHQHPNKYPTNRSKYYYDPIYSHSQAPTVYGGSGINKKKRKRAISPPQSCHSYLPTPPIKPSIANSSLSSFPMSIPVTPPPPPISSATDFKTPLMSWSSSMPIIPNSGATAAVNAAAYVTYHHHHHHHHHHYHYNTPNALINRIQCLEIE